MQNFWLKLKEILKSHCGFYNLESGDSKRAETYSHKGTTRPGASGHISAFTYVTISGSSLPPVDPMIQFEESIYRVLYGRDPDPQPFKKRDESENITSNGTDMMAHYPTGQGFRGEVFQNKSAVHLPFLEFVHRGHCHLRITKDYMQTAINAFAIFVAGNLDDILRLPSQYVLHSARTIAMMKIAREKLAATWTVVKGSTPTEAITYEVLEKYRPLFKYLTGKEMAKLNLTDERILSYIGTHPDLSRHQVGVVASRYIQINPAWTEPKYLNMMNNLLCGVPMIFMRRIPENTYLQLTHQALGKSYSWSAREVSRLGLLLAEVTGQDLSAINPEAMSGITAQPAAGASGERRASLGSHVTEARTKFEARARRASSAGAGEPAAAAGATPVRPFLTRGSVAERVLMFERCPSEATLELAKRKSPAATTWRGPHDVINRAQVGGR
ncbi:unnamed protein product [Chrysodeixis includens]|uniref:Uncharacterized protein n=1 Tax=Chrysodeixis includens TaxID=689277 RepID=A0A9N8PZG3_CHRIL|nr:unnamed protein product [Chrysodeixis includens]